MHTKEQYKEYCLKNKEKIRLKNKRWYDKNIEKILAEKREYYQTIKEDVKLHRKTPWGFTTKLWSGIRWRINDTSLSNASYSGLKITFTKNYLYNEVLKNWNAIETMFKNNEEPSIDRINPDIGYEEGNIQFIPMLENASKSRTVRDVNNGRFTKNLSIKRQDR